MIKPIFIPVKGESLYTVKDIPMTCRMFIYIGVAALIGVIFVTPLIIEPASYPFEGRYYLLSYSATWDLANCRWFAGSFSALAGLAIGLPLDALVSRMYKRIRENK
jgi:hypothetical protein